MERRLRTPSPAFVISLIALFVALGGTSYAATILPKNSVGTRQLKKNAVTSAKIKNGAVTATKVNTGGLTVPNALHATSADTATNASHATTAGSAPPPGSAGGGLAGSYPSPSIAAAPAPSGIAANPNNSVDPCSGVSPQTGIYCGTSGFHWQDGFYGDEGVQFWRDRLGEVHIRGEAAYPAVFPAKFNGVIFYLPPGDRPKNTQTFPVAVGFSAGAFQAGSALLFISAADGSVELLDPEISGNDVFIGDIEFRTDA
jgi:hypothetical protein